MGMVRAEAAAAPRDLHGRSVLVTGGLGFIGAALATFLCRAGARVRVLDALLPQSGGSPRNLGDAASDIDVIIEDARSRDAVNRAVAGCDVVFHLAGPSSPGALPVDWYTEIDIACAATLHVLEATRLYAPEARLVFASSHHVYRLPAPLPVAEHWATDPATMFGVHKLAGEKYCGLYQRSHGLDVAIARLGIVFGPRQRLAGAGGPTAAYALDAALHGDDVQVPLGGGPVLDLIHVDAAVRALATLGASPALEDPLVNVASGTGTRLADFAATVLAATGAGAGQLVETEALRGEADFVADVRRLRALGAAPAPSALADAVRDTVEWFLGGEDAL